MAAPASMIERPASPSAEPSHQPDPVPPPREAIVAHYGAQLHAALRRMQVVAGDLAAYLEFGSDPALFMARAVEFDELVREAGGAMTGLGHIMTADGTC